MCLLSAQDWTACRRAIPAADDVGMAGGHACLAEATATGSGRECLHPGRAGSSSDGPGLGRTGRNTKPRPIPCSLRHGRIRLRPPHLASHPYRLPLPPPLRKLLGPSRERDGNPGRAGHHAASLLYLDPRGPESVSVPWVAQGHGPRRVGCGTTPRSIGPRSCARPSWSGNRPT